MKSAEILSVGTELLLGQIVDTHSATAARALAECGLSCQRRATVGDHLGRATQLMRESLQRADLLITIGGLGPTQDDLTRQAIAAALDDELVLNPDYLQELKSMFERRRLPWVESNARQAMFPTSAVALPNPNGSAPGLLCQKDGKVVIALPGPKNEFDPMMESHVRPFLKDFAGGGVIHSRVLRVRGIGESMLEDRLLDLMQSENPTLAPYAKLGEVHLRLTARAASVADAEEALEPLNQEIRRRLGPMVYAEGETPVENLIVDLLQSSAQTVSVAESLTGGLVASRITSVPGASQVFPSGIVAYSREAKEELVGVHYETLDKFGMVSRETAMEMASEVRVKCQTHWGVATTGNAGPTALEDQPVGLVWVAVHDGSTGTASQIIVRGNRDSVRTRAAQEALVLLHHELTRSRNP